MKKILCMLLLLIFCFALVACGTQSTPSTNDTVTSSEEAKNKLSELYNSVDGSSFLVLGYDGMSLTLDTNPTDIPDFDGGAKLVALINSYLGLPSSLTTKMASTRALDGMQTQNCGEYTVTWNYHPDKGMKVIYEVNP